MRKGQTKGQMKIQVQENNRFSVPRFSKGQMKIQEMAFMLLAVIVLFALAGMFFLVIMYNNLIGSANLLAREKAISTAVNIANTPEFSCGGALCIDADKLIVLQNRQDYEDFWPVERIVVTKVSGDKETIECTEKNYPYCNYFKVYDSGITNIEMVETFAALCRKDKANEYIYDKCELARVLVGFEKKQP